MFRQITRSASSHSNTEKSKSQLQTSFKGQVEFSILFLGSAIVNNADSNFRDLT